MAKEEMKATKRGTSDGMMISHNMPKPEKQKPSFEVDEEHLPEIKDWQVGKKYHVHAHVEMRSHSKGDSYGYDGGEKKMHRARLIVHSVRAVEDEKEKENKGKSDEGESKVNKKN